jgi:HD-like signal output (HDOD) protein
MTITTLSDERLLTVAKTLPVAPQIMARLHQMLLDTNSGLSEIAHLLKRDVSLTTRIIRIANSPAYKGNGLGSIEEALQRVGFGEVFRLVGVAANATLADTSLKCYGYTSEAFGVHNLCTGLVAEGLAKRTGLDTRLAYTTGLLNCIGQILLDRVGRDMLSPSETFLEAGGGRLIEWERQVFGVAHFEVAALLLGHWGFPDLVVKAVAHDHSSKLEASPLAKNLRLAECIVRFAGYGLAGEESSWGIPHEELIASHIAFEDAQEVRDEAVAALRALQAA